MVEGAPLLREYTGDGIVGSNPILSATKTSNESFPLSIAAGAQFALTRSDKKRQPNIPAITDRYCDRLANAGAPSLQLPSECILVFWPNRPSRSCIDHGETAARRRGTRRLSI